MWRCGDSNPVPPACKAGALPDELHPRGGASWTRTRGLSLIRTALSPPELMPQLPNNPRERFQRVNLVESAVLTHNTTRLCGDRPRIPSPLPAPYELITHSAQLMAHGYIPRKEVIQPHLPVRLPCYDFTPVTWPTFDGCLPCGLAHRLQVFQASMV